MTTPSESGWPQVPPPPRARAAAETPLGGQLHPAAMAVWSLGQVGAIVVLFLINPASMVFALPFIAFVAIANFVRYARFRWHYADGVLVIEQGLLNRQRRVIPVERVQSVDLVRRVSHRLFGVTAVQVEAIGSGDTEGKLDALSLDVAGRLRETLLAGRAAARGEEVAGERAAAEADAGEVLVRVPNRRLLVAGATEANATLLAAVAGGLWQLFGDRLEELVERLPALLAGNAFVVAILGALLVALVLLITAQVVLHWNFELRLAGNELQVRRGLLEQRFDTVPLRRVQAVRIEENLPRRLLGLAAVRADVAGKPGGGSGGTDTLLPIGRAGDARELVGRVLGDAGVARVGLARMPGRARTRRLFRAGVFTAVVTVAAAVVWGVPGLAAVLLVGLPAVGIAESSYRALGHAELPGFVATRSGWWVRRTAFVPEGRLQTLACTATVLQRWRRLATLELQIARSPGLWSGPQMIDLDRKVAWQLVGAFAPIMSAPRGSGDRARAARLAHGAP